MQRYYDELLNEKRGPFDVIVDKTYEDLSPRDLFDCETEEEIDEICRKIDHGILDWFMLRCRVFFDGVELGSDYVGGFLYEDPRDVLKDGIVEDMIYTAMEEAKKEAAKMKQRFAELVI